MLETGLRYEPDDATREAAGGAPTQTWFSGRVVAWDGGALFFAGTTGDGDVLLTRPGRVEWRFRGDPSLVPDRVELLLADGKKYVAMGAARLVLLTRIPSTGDVDADFKLETVPPASRWVELKRGGRKVRKKKVKPPDWAKNLDVEAFVADWLGWKKPVAAPPPDVPPPLARLYALAGEKIDRLRVQNRLLRPDELEKVDGRTVFYVENQGVAVWAYPGDGGNDPPVDVRIDGEWRRTASSLSVFLLQAAIFERVFGAEFLASATWTEPANADAALDPLALLPLEPWQRPVAGLRFYAARDAIGWAHPNLDGVTVWIGARRKKALAHVHELHDGEWDISV